MGIEVPCEGEVGDPCDPFVNTPSDSGVCVGTDPGLVVDQLSFVVVLLNICVLACVYAYSG